VVCLIKSGLKMSDCEKQIIYVILGNLLEDILNMTKRLGGYKKFPRNSSLDIQAQNFRKRLGLGVPRK